MTISEDIYKTVLDNLYEGIYFVDPERRITYWNRGAERISGYTSEMVIGKSCSENILIHVDDDGHPLCAHDCPLIDAMRDREARSAEIYLHHADGHRIPVFVHVTPLFNEQGKVVGAAEVFSENTPMAAALNKVSDLEKTVALDALTGVGSRRYTETQLRSSLNQLKRFQLPFGVLFIDIDRFKNINDTHGHHVGDEVLKMVANTLKHNVRSSDYVGRWGGEEFVIILVNIEKPHLQQIAEKLRMLVETSQFGVDGTIVRVTVSIGGVMAEIGDSLEALLKSADRLLYQSKAAGRNHVTV